MKHANIDIFLRLLGWLDQGLTCWLCTVTHTWGSSPRPQGSLMASNSLGERAGSLSGGCIEDALLEKLAAEDLQQPAFLLYGASAEEAERLRLPCGGTVGVLVEPVSRAYYPHLLEIVEALQERRCITRQVDFSAAVYRLEDGRPGSFTFIQHPQEGKPLLLRHSIGPRSQLFIIGASDVAQAVAELAQWLDIEVIVCDPRTELLQQWPLSGCVLLNMLPDEALQAYADNPQLLVVALTHDPRIDDMGLLQAFASQACYIGAMGSQQTSARRRERLQALGIEAQQLARLHAPLGLAIGSKTPREIAIAFMAELVQHKHLS